MGGYYNYHRNRACSCARCRIRLAMGPAMLITIGVLFLLQTLDIYPFHLTWPLILIVVGVVQVLAHSASTEGHIDPWGRGTTPVPPPPATAPPAPPAASSTTSGGGSEHV
jgi:hypothetical protein